MDLDYFSASHIATVLLVFLEYEFHNEVALFQSFSIIGKLFYAFYAIAAVLVIRPHIRQAMRYKHGEAGRGDFCHRAQYEAMFWRLAPLLYAATINSKLLFISVMIDLIGRIWTMHEAHHAESRFQVIGNGGVAISGYPLSLARAHQKTL
ncbi:MAG: hypothetical protein WCG50_18855 [Rhodoferax sp.]|uniref:hypothetical protein n=1 Tax=Rhodoferax sp. TaxID=50421 RepID=UPI00301A65B3